MDRIRDVILNRVSAALARSGRIADTAIREALAARGLKPGHAHVLSLLAERGRLSQRALLEELGVDPSVLVTLLNVLEDRGLVTRRRDPRDRRRHIVEISADGVALVAEVDEAVLAVEKELFADLDQEEVRTLRALLDRIAAADARACTE